MLKVDIKLTHVVTTKDRVLSVYESINMPLVSIPNIGTATTQAFVIGVRNEHGAYTVLVVLRQSDNDANLVYVSDPYNLTAEQYRHEEAEGLRFVESMGFLMNDVAFRGLDPGAQDAYLDKTPVFTVPGRTRSEPTMDLTEVEDDAVESIPDPIFGGIVGSGIGSGIAPNLGSGIGSGIVSNLGSGIQMLKGEPESPPTFGSSPGNRSFRPSPPQSRLPTPDHASSRPAAAPTPAPQPPATPEPPDPEVLARLGRFLSTFALLAALGGSLGLPAGCATVPPKDELTDQARNQLDIAEQLLSQSNWPQAINAFDEVLRLAPGNKFAHHGAGLAYLYLGRSEQAEAHFRQAIEADPKFSIAKNSLATLLLGAHRCDEAAELLKAVLDDIFYPTPHFAEDNLAKAEHCLGRSQDAIARLTRVVEKRPTFCLGYLTLADISAEAKQPETTIRACDQFMNRCERHEKIGKLVSPEQRAMCYLRKGLAYASLGDIESARQALASCDSDGAYGRECRRSLELIGER
ncbi:MAG: tetratricopeptide repeat protein [Myxococcota bacterium]